MKICDAFNRFLDTECLVYVTYATVNGSVIPCTLKEIGEDWIRIVQEDGTESIVNLINVIRIREYPRNKNGKKKSMLEY